MHLLIAIIILAACWSAPFPLAVIIVLADFLIPDPLPMIDEILMIMIFSNRLKKILFVQNLIHKYKILAGILIVLILIGIFALISWLLGILGI